MPDILVFIGLIIGAGLYWQLVRRRVIGRMGGAELARQLSASNEVALARIRDAPRQRADAPPAVRSQPAVELGDERRSGERRGIAEQRRGRGRRTGGDRRRK